VGKVNKVLDDTGVITESVSTPLSNMSQVISGLKTGMSILSIFTKSKKKTKETEDNG
jgi:hypothetical protein